MAAGAAPSGIDFSTYRPTSFFVALCEGALVTDRLRHSRYNSQTTQASVRIGHTLRF